MAFLDNPVRARLFFLLAFILCLACGLGCVAASNHSKNPPSSSCCTTCTCACTCTHMAPPPAATMAKHQSPWRAFSVTVFVAVIVISLAMFFLSGHLEAVTQKITSFLGKSLVSSICALIVFKWMMEIENANAGNAFIVFAVTLFLSSFSSFMVLVATREDAAKVSAAVLGKQIAQIGLLLGLKGFGQFYIYLSAIISVVSILAVKTNHGELLNGEAVEELASLATQAIELQPQGP